MKILYVGNWRKGTSNSELRNMFAVYGAVETVNIIADRHTGCARGFALVVMPNSSEAEMAIMGLNGSRLGGRTSNASEAKPKADRPRGNGQHFRRGGSATTYAQESRRHNS